MCKGAWDSETSVLEVGNEVTVHGEKAGGEVALESTWGRITALPRDDNGDYEVEDADGVKQRVPRKALRHRSSVQQAHVGITADPTHDSYSMRTFVGAFLKHLRGQGILKAQDLRALAVHSDNASQHFKSSKTLKWFSSLRRRTKGEKEPGPEDVPKFGSVVYDFGAPGHRKG